MPKQPIYPQNSVFYPNIIKKLKYILPTEAFRGLEQLKVRI